MTEKYIQKLVHIYRFFNHEKARQTIILDHINMARAIAYTYIKINYRDKDDILSIAYVELCDAVARSQYSLKNNMITGYLFSSIKGQILNFLNKKKDDLLIFPEKFPELQKYLVGSDLDYDNQIQNLLKEIEDPLTKRIINLIMEGYTYREIVPMTGYSIDTISRRVQDVQEAISNAGASVQHKAAYRRLAFVGETRRKARFLGRGYKQEYNQE